MTTFQLTILSTIPCRLPCVFGLVGMTWTDWEEDQIYLVYFETDRGNITRKTD